MSYEFKNFYRVARSLTCGSVFANNLFFPYFILKGIKLRRHVDLKLNKFDQIFHFTNDSKELRRNETK